MKLEITIGEIVEAYKAFQKIAGEASIGLSWAIDDIKEVLSKHTTRYDSERDKIFEKYGEKVPGQLPGQFNFRLKREDSETAIAEIKVLEEIKVEIEFSPLAYEVFESEQLRVDVRSAKVLRPFIQVVKKKVEKVKETTKRPAKVREPKVPQIVPKAD